MTVNINLSKAKAVTHEMRRAARAYEFSPLDEQIALQLPGVDAETIEAERQAIRDRYAVLQTQIEGAEDLTSLRSIVSNLQTTIAEQSAP